VFLLIQYYVFVGQNRNPSGGYIMHKNGVHDRIAICYLCLLNCSRLTTKIRRLFVRYDLKLISTDTYITSLDLNCLILLDWNVIS
jgi:hypothetical protein